MFCCRAAIFSTDGSERFTHRRDEALVPEGQIASCGGEQPEQGLSRVVADDPQQRAHFVEPGTPEAVRPPHRPWHAQPGSHVACCREGLQVLRVSLRERRQHFVRLRGRKAARRCDKDRHRLRSGLLCDLRGAPAGPAQQRHQSRKAHVELSVGAQRVEQSIRRIAGTTKRVESLRLGPRERGTTGLEPILVGVGERKAVDRF